MSDDLETITKMANNLNLEAGMFDDGTPFEDRVFIGDKEILGRLLDRVSRAWAKANAVVAAARELLENAETDGATYEKALADAIEELDKA